MSALGIEAVHVSAPRVDDDEPAHIVCHCSGDQVAWCALPLEDDAAWVDDDDIECPLCGLVYEDLYAADMCPWGCSCDECAGR